MDAAAAAAVSDDNTISRRLVWRLVGDRFDLICASSSFVYSERVNGKTHKFENDIKKHHIMTSKNPRNSGTYYTL